jgi:hypothetical protein
MTPRRFLALLVFLLIGLSVAVAAPKKPTKKEQEAECQFQLDRCADNCTDNFRWKDPNAIGDAKVLEACMGECRGAYNTCHGNITIIINPANRNESGGAGTGRSILQPQ